MRTFSAMAVSAFVNITKHIRAALSDRAAKSVPYIVLWLGELNFSLPSAVALGEILVGLRMHEPVIFRLNRVSVQK